MVETMERRELLSTLWVDNLNDSGTGSLRQAIDDAMSGDTIEFRPGVQDQYGVPMAGVPVTFSVPTVGPGGTFEGAGTVTAITDAQGIATAPTFTANPVEGTYAIMAAAANLSVRAGMTNLPGPPTTMVVTGAAQTTTVGTAFAAPLGVVVTDAYGNPVAGVVVTFTAPTIGPGASFGGVGSVAVVTDGQGRLTTPAVTANTVAGSYAITATIAGVSAPAIIQMTNRPAAPAAVVPVTGSGQVATVATGFAVPLAVIVIDAYGNREPGVPVQFLAPVAGPGGSFWGPSAVVVATDAAGYAGVYFAANAVAGNYVVMAAVAGVAAPAGFGLINVPGAPAIITATSGGQQIAPVGRTFYYPLTVTVTDQFGNPVAGVPVTFQSFNWGLGGLFSNGQLSITVLTDAAGMAAATISAGNRTGNFDVAATVVGVATPAVFHLRTGWSWGWF